MVLSARLEIRLDYNLIVFSKTFASSTWIDLFKQLFIFITSRYFKLQMSRGFATPKKPTPNQYYIFPVDEAIIIMEINAALAKFTPKQTENAIVLCKEKLPKNILTKRNKARSTIYLQVGEMLVKCNLFSTDDMIAYLQNNKAA